MSLMSACLCLVYACSHVCSSSRLSLISVGVLAHSCVYVFLVCAYMLSCECFAASPVLTAPQCLAALACWLSSTARCSSAMTTAALGDLWCSAIPGARALGFFAASPMLGNGPCPSVSVPTSSTCPLSLPLLLYHTIFLRQTWIGRWLAANGGHRCSEHRFTVGIRIPLARDLCHFSPSSQHWHSFARNLGYFFWCCGQGPKPDNHISKPFWGAWCSMFIFIILLGHCRAPSFSRLYLFCTWSTVHFSGGQLLFATSRGVWCSYSR